LSKNHKLSIPFYLLLSSSGQGESVEAVVSGYAYDMEYGINKDLLQGITHHAALPKDASDLANMSIEELRQQVSQMRKLTARFGSEVMNLPILMQKQQEDESKQVNSGPVEALEAAVQLILRTAKEKNICIPHLRGRCRFQGVCKNWHFHGTVCFYPKCTRGVIEDLEWQAHFNEHFKILAAAADLKVDPDEYFYARALDFFGTIEDVRDCGSLREELANFSRY
jgi:hypothetical protein